MRNIVYSEYNTAYYVGDSKEGTEIGCSACNWEGLVPEGDGEPCICPGCAKEIFYPQWCEW